MVSKVHVVDQRNIQSRGGKCAKYPISCLLHDMLEKTMHSLEHMAVLDVTYGQGRFYGAWRPRLLLGCDVRIHSWVVKPDWFSIVPSWSAWRMVRKLGVTIDVVVVDPPWSRYIYYRRPQFNTAYGSIKDILYGGIRTAKEIRARYLLVHYREPVELDDWIPLETIEFHPVSRYINNIDGTRSYFMLFENPERAMTIYEEFFIMH